jgi:hypothetical protein
VQDKLREEIHSTKRLAAGLGRDVTLQDVQAMPYLNAVASEVLRYGTHVRMLFMPTHLSAYARQSPRFSESQARTTLCPSPSPFD